MCHIILRFQYQLEQIMKFSYTELTKTNWAYWIQMSMGSKCPIYFDTVKLFSDRVQGTEVSVNAEAEAEAKSIPGDFPPQQKRPVVARVVEWGVKKTTTFPKW